MIVGRFSPHHQGLTLSHRLESLAGALVQCIQYYRHVRDCDHERVIAVGFLPLHRCGYSLVLRAHASRRVDAFVPFLGFNINVFVISAFKSGADDACVGSSSAIILRDPVDEISDMLIILAILQGGIS